MMIMMMMTMMMVTLIISEAQLACTVDRTFVAWT